MSKQLNQEQNYNQVVNQAVAELLEALTAKELSESLTGMFQGYLRSDFSDDRSDRMFSCNGYENMKAFLKALQNCESQNRAALINNLKSQSQSQC